MKIYKLENYKEIYTNKTLIELMNLTMFNATIGRIKSAAQSVYSKEQGRFYVAKEDDYLAILGVKRVDNKKVDILHFAVSEEYQHQGIGKKIMEAMIEIERVEEIHAKPEKIKFFKKFGFKISNKEDRLTGIYSYTCIYKC